MASLRQCRFVLIVLANFIVVPAMGVVLVRALGLQRDAAIGLILLAAAPFAPVVPVFARLARADLALAAGLTSVFPVLSVLLTPVVCAVALRAVPDAGAIQFHMLGVLLILGATITLPLAVGMAIHHRAPRWGQRLLRPVEVVSEATGALALAFVTVTEFQSVLETGWRSMLAMGLLSELSLLLGYGLGKGAVGSRRVVALGTSNRNIALALLVALQSFAGTPVVPAVVANGLLLILLGLLHVAWWRLVSGGSGGIEPVAGG